jgi:hypothetical protein
MLSFATTTVTVVRPNYIVQRGDSIPNWSDTVSHDIPNCIVQPLVGAEVLGDRDSVEYKWKMFLPANSDITSYDRVIHLGVTYEVDGDIQRWPSPSGSITHDECSLNLVRG